MDAEIEERTSRKHVGRNLQKIRVYLGMKQEALATDLGVSHYSGNPTYIKIFIGFNYFFYFLN